MGFSLSWIAFRGQAPAHGLACLGLTDTGEIADYGSAAISGVGLPTGWHLVVAKRAEGLLISTKVLAPFSKEFEVVACSIEEHAMFSSAELWERGARSWRIEHSGERSRRDLRTEGSMPFAFQLAVDTARNLQDEEDASVSEVDHFFEIPLEVAYRLTGFKHDEGASGVPFDAFHKHSASLDGAGLMANRPWWRFWR